MCAGEFGYSASHYLGTPSQLASAVQLVCCAAARQLWNPKQLRQLAASHLEKAYPFHNPARLLLLPLVLQIAHLLREAILAGGSE
jgi:hypothetical protein